MGSALDRARLIAGRRQDPHRPYEVTISEGLGHLRIGDHLTAGSMTPAQMQLILGGNDPGPAPVPASCCTWSGSSGGPSISVTARRQVASSSSLRPSTTNSPAASGSSSPSCACGPSTAHPTSHACRPWRQDVRRVGFFQITDLAAENGGAESAIDVVALALWIFAGVTALAGAIAIGIVLAARSPKRAPTNPRCFARDDRGSRIAIGMLPAYVAAGSARSWPRDRVAASPLLPVGIARRADPNPGFHADWIVLLVGIAALGAFVLGSR